MCASCLWGAIYAEQLSLESRRFAGQIVETKDFAVGLNLPVSNQASKFWIAISSEKLDAVGSHGGDERDRSCTGAF
jgi:hypothetical protein